MLAEIMAIPAKAIPEGLLAEAQGVAIIPDVIKIGFIAGRGVGMAWSWFVIRKANGACRSSSL